MAWRLRGLGLRGQLLQLQHVLARVPLAVRDHHEGQLQLINFECAPAHSNLTSFWKTQGPAEPCWAQSTFSSSYISRALLQEELSLSSLEKSHPLVSALLRNSELVGVDLRHSISTVYLETGNDVIGLLGPVCLLSAFT